MVEEKDPILVAKVMDVLTNDENVRQAVLEQQRNRLKDFEYDRIKEQLEQYLKKFIGECPK